MPFHILYIKKFKFLLSGYDRHFFIIEKFIKVYFVLNSNYFLKYMYCNFSFLIYCSSNTNIKMTFAGPAWHARPVRLAWSEGLCRYPRLRRSGRPPGGRGPPGAGWAAGATGTPGRAGTRGAQLGWHQGREMHYTCLLPNIILRAIFGLAQFAFSLCSRIVSIM